MCFLDRTWLWIGKIRRQPRLRLMPRRHTVVAAEHKVEGKEGKGIEHRGIMGTVMLLALAVVMLVVVRELELDTVV